MTLCNRKFLFDEKKKTNACVKEKGRIFADLKKNIKYNTVLNLRNVILVWQLMVVPKRQKDHARARR